MIKAAPDFNLGLDTTRMKDPRDAERQHATVDALLGRFFHPNTNDRTEIQILADEVGMGKTFVALAVAYSILAHMRTVGSEGDLEGCYKRVLVITPRNSALFSKWRREVSEFVKRCILPEHRKDAARWFAPEPVERVDELVTALKRRGRGPRVLIASMGLFYNAKLTYYDLKRRALLGALFRHWGKRFRVDRRKRLLRGAPEGWSRDPYGLLDLEETDWDRTPFAGEEELMKTIRRLDKDREDGTVDRLLELCCRISEPYVHGRKEKFEEVERLLTRAYRRVTEKAIRWGFPLLIVDEAHHWKNGPKGGANGFPHFQRFIAPHVRRALLLTATPFQLRPDEILEILRVSDDMAPTPHQATRAQRRESLRQQREDVIRPVLNNSALSSRRFSKAWASLPLSVDACAIERVWRSSTLENARERLRELAELKGVVNEPELRATADEALQAVDPAIRGLLREALLLYAYNSDLSQELGTFVIRHRRTTGHRLFRVGTEYRADRSHATSRPDHHVLHAAAGLDVRGPGEMPHYILMRCVTEMKMGKGKSSLGNALTGCYSTLLHSAEGKEVKRSLRDSARGRVYLDLLMGLVGEDQDEKHPKMKAVVDEIVNVWRNGEKSLIFCFRVNTARRVRDIVDKRIRRELDRRRKKCLGGEAALKALRGRLTGRDQGLVPLGMDRVLWSFRHALERHNGRPFSPKVLLLADQELHELARLALQFGVDLRGERVDRVFVHRATEHILAKRLLEEEPPSPEWRRLLSEMGDAGWVSAPYGLEQAEDGDEGGEDQTDFDERGVHKRYEQREDPTATAIETLAKDLIERRARVRVSVLDVYAKGPSLWLGLDPARPKSDQSNLLRNIHSHLYGLTSENGEFDWHARLRILQALRRALLRESVLLRLLPDKADRDESGWGELLVQAFFAPLRHQRESMADKVAVFLEDLLAASGNIHEPGSQRFVLLDSTSLRDEQFVALVGGSGVTKKEAKERIFAGFNTPLLPEVLICTAVGQEGIDLHRHCRHVVHFDLAWNPAILEQRTGRADRIGSKTFRERALARDGEPPFLEVGVPFLAGTYDERMYEELRLRAQTFEVLTGGDLAADNAEGMEQIGSEEGEGRDLRLLNLPSSMIEDLRARLEVWTEP